jgi:hypothetical protein
MAAAPSPTIAVFKLIWSRYQSYWPAAYPSARRTDRSARLMAMEYIIYSDESESKGRHFSNFYGGALVRSDDLDYVKDAIAKKKRDLNLFGEIKWSKITVAYHKKYIEMIDFFFDLVKKGKVKIRIMFTQNAMRPKRLTRNHVDNQYAILSESSGSERKM